MSRPVPCASQSNGAYAAASPVLGVYMLLVFLSAIQVAEHAAAFAPIPVHGPSAVQESEAIRTIQRSVDFEVASVNIVEHARWVLAAKLYFGECSVAATAVAAVVLADAGSAM